MATGLRLDPEFASVLERSRRRAHELGEFPRTAAKPAATAVSSEAREIITAWARGGGYEAAVAEIGAEDPDLANE